MSWLLWRQHRAQGLVAAIVVVLFGTAVAITGISMAHEYHTYQRNCVDGTCLANRLFDGDGAIIDVVHLSILLPVLLGVFLGATLIARETEHQTNVLVWTQTVTRRGWVLTKVAFALVAAFVISSVVSALVTWWSGTPNSLNGDRFEGAQFDTQNITPVAFALFAVALGIAMGALLRRTLPAIAATVGAYIGVRLLVALYVRPHYLAPTVASAQFPVDAAVPSGSWTMSRQITDGAGHSLSKLSVPPSCPATDKAGVEACLRQLGYRTQVRFQPPSHYWPFQWMETGIFVGLAAILVVIAVVVTLRRDA
jgi:hypothetical protein